MPGHDSIATPVVVSAQEQPHDYRIPGGVVTMHPTYRLRMPTGRVHEFEWHKFCGPTFLRADGEPRMRHPGERNPLWKPFCLWVEQGHRVDQEGNCVWDIQGRDSRPLTSSPP